MRDILKNNDRALEEYQKVLSAQPENMHALQNCFDIYYAENQDEKALKIAQKLVEIQKSHYTYSVYLKILIKMGKIQDTLKIFNNLDEDIKLNSDILYLISKISGENARRLLSL